jgi:arsenate reductase
MKKVYHLSTCQTCKRIIAETRPGKEFVLQNIKEQAITSDQLDEMKSLAGSYEALFTKRSMKFRAWNLQNMDLKEKDMRKLILKDYTFLKRPVFIIGDEIFVGSSKAVVDAIKQKIR